VKVKNVTTSSGELYGYRIDCPGCGDPHVLTTGWTFNGSYDRPTFSPSLLVTKPNGPERCHSFITDGQIRYLSDCTHAMAGQTVDLPEIVIKGEP